MQVLRATDAARLKPLVHQPPAADDLTGWLALARMLAQLHRELAAEAFYCGDILKHGRELETFNEAERWQLLAELQQRISARARRPRIVGRSNRAARRRSNGASATLKGKSC